MAGVVQSDRRQAARLDMRLERSGDAAGPERVAAKVLSAVERGKAEMVVPWFPYGLGAMAQAIVPTITARVLKHFDYPDDP